MIYRHLRGVLILLLAAAFFMSPLSQVLCSEGCVGGACETPLPAAVCELDATGGCCGDAEPAEEFTLVDPNTPQLTDPCRVCPCFEAGQIGDFVVPEGTGRLKWTPAGVVVSSPAPVTAPFSAQRSAAEPSALTSHGPPPLYQLHCALLI